MATDKLVIRGARVHNLKNITVEIPRDKLVVITGLSGSGKSSLAFDTIYAEGQRRYVESLSAYARQFLGQMEKPDVDMIEGLSPAVSIDQKTRSHNPRSTVGTVTEIYDHLRLLFARIGRPHCPECGQEISQQSIQQMIDQIEALPEDTRLLLLGPVIKGRKGEYRQILDDIRKQGFVRARIDGKVRDLVDKITLARYKQHTIEVVVDRLQVKAGMRQRLADSLELALKIGKGVASAQIVDGEELQFSELFACQQCQRSFEELQPRMFSFNSPYGACPECTGLGNRMVFDENLVIPDRSLSLGEGAILPWRNLGSQYHYSLLRSVAHNFDIDWDKPLKKLAKAKLDILLHGSDKLVRVRYRGRGGRLRIYNVYFEGVLSHLEAVYKREMAGNGAAGLEQFMNTLPCPACKGARLKPESLAVTIAGKNIAEVCALSIQQCADFFDKLKLTQREATIARQILKEIRTRLGFLRGVGLDYLTVDRSAKTLAGGEAQRIRLATQIGSGLMGVLYILDEPSVGLHQRDNNRLLDTLCNLRDMGNTILVVEHDEATMRRADWIIDIGPGAGEHGGKVVATGSVKKIIACPASITGKYLSGKKTIPVPKRRRRHKEQWLEVIGARQHNLKNITVRVPLGLFVCITGVSGSGKSTLLDEIIYRRLAHRLNGARTTWGEHDEIRGSRNLDKVIDIDQSPIGRTPRSNPATYTGVFDHIRQLFAQTPEARARGYKPGRFSFNVRGGRCEACQGDGIIKIEMQFLPDVYVPCEVCRGARYNRQTLEVRYKGKSISDVLNMIVEEALEFFANITPIRNKLQTLHDVGLGYIHLGQPATTLSGGEAQRVKLATELSRRATGRTLYILDEPTTGLHFDDIKRLLEVLDRLVSTGNSVMVIEHNPDVIKCADYVIDLGPEGGDGGGEVIADGSPEEVAKRKHSHTGRLLRQILPAKKRAGRPRALAAG
ncbi:MAG: excinuclease ABC subunit UvrA [Armatimonadetes bacterium]|nr:excinuclease ABC subunit UvrA [Armatimonadota bacterium]NIM23863.1 excinuclease ABC subunit UvrA [Armatimonadota bacterium]NIM67742.1 excinuclease ABC subunit UvrA [Armatimonadota bacterium]NIM76251.1 excinuclease ABC subunit UvrA [Armatimonadota bacterium]NIN05944.1 excinuclease ABC subunit UvrA [Armatimonadota bacterium]